MGGKKCCIENCSSSSTRKEDAGVTFHKYPKDEKIRNHWLSVTLQEHSIIETLTVCSRHFCKSDFQIYKDSKYILKSDAVPSIFPWSNLDMESPEKAADASSEDHHCEGFNEEVSSNIEDSKGENLEAIKKFIEEQEKEIQQLEAKVNPEARIERLISSGKDDKNKDIEKASEITADPTDIKLDSTSDKIDVLLETEKKIKNEQKSPKTFTSPGGSSMALAVGSRVEAKDFSELWYPAQIVEVDYEEMEVLVRYDNVSKKHDEWISVSSPRLRPLGSGDVTDDVTQSENEASLDETTADSCDVSVKEEKSEKPKLSFNVGERCLARWRDNRRFMATVSEELGDDQYKITFDDGTHWQCPVSRLCKLTDSTPLPLDSHLSPGEPYVSLTSLPYNTHLFDPARDYLGSKSERRALKRKLNIKEIFNIGQKKKKEGAKKPRIVRKKSSTEVKSEVKVEIASESVLEALLKTEPQEPKQETSIETEQDDVKMDIITPKEPPHTDKPMDDKTEVTSGKEPPLRDMKVVLKKLDFEKMSPIPENVEKEQVVEDDKLEVVTIDINDGDLDSSIDDGDQRIDIDNIEATIFENASSITETQIEQELLNEPSTSQAKDRITLKIDKVMLSKPKKSKKSSHEERVKSKVEKVKSEIEEMKRRMEQMKKKVKTKPLVPLAPITPLPASVLAPEQWCCRWLNGQPVGAVSELATPGRGLPRRSVQVEDKRLPPEWTKHMVRRSQGNSAGKWDIVIISPDCKRFHNKTDMKNYLDTLQDDSLKVYEYALMDFGAHRKLSRRLGWEVTTDGSDEPPVVPLPAESLTMSPLVKRKLPKAGKKAKQDLARKLKKKSLSLKRKQLIPSCYDPSVMDTPPPMEEYQPPLEEGYVYVGSLKVQILENLLRCPADACFKNFRNNTLLQMHIKHYHKELISKMGATPKVLDLASARTKAPVLQEAEYRTPKSKPLKVPRHLDDGKTEFEQDLQVEVAPGVVKTEMEKLPRPQDSPRLLKALTHAKPPKRPKVLLPIRKSESEPTEDVKPEEEDIKEEKIVKEEDPSVVDFESAISPHMLNKTQLIKKTKKRKFVSATVCPSDEDSSDFDTRSSIPRSGSPDKMMDASPNIMSSESNDATNQFMVTDTGEKVKIEHMKREEIINCHCGLREEDGLMIQCELCLCWQHALCHNIRREAEVPSKYTCSICLAPRRGRRSRRFVHDQDRLYEGLLPGAAPSEPLRRSHELSGNLIRIGDALHALRVKFYVATKKDHPKLYLWAKEWDTGSLQQNDYLDLGALVRDLGKENLPAGADDFDPDRLSQGSVGLGAAALLGSLLASPGDALDLPLSTSDLESLANTVQESELHTAPAPAPAPQPEAAIENGACRERLLKHIQRCQALIDARLDSIEAQVAELESQDPSFEDDETPEFFPRTKQTIQMMLRDLDTMEELGVIT